jgi:site-specific recombinase XerD
MKHLILSNPHYTYLLNNYKNYLATINYSKTTQETYPLHVKELLHYIENKHKALSPSGRAGEGLHITHVQPRIIYNFIDYIKTRKNKKQNSLLSNNHINKIISACNSFAWYLNKSGNHIIDVHGKRLEDNSVEKTILTIEEIKQLYDNTFEPYAWNSKAYGQRDRTIIALLYGCGLRISEAKQLNITDVDLIKQVVFVKKAKGYKQRYVPIASKHSEDIKEYLQEGRMFFLNDNSQTYYKKKPRLKSSKASNSPPSVELEGAEAFFISQYGTRMKAGFYSRLKSLKERTGIQKTITPHGLRHSIATHLLQGGMKIDDIATFLGHSSLDSTQIYTHIVNSIIK